ncbi:hypothetical protein PMAG_a0187 [Pseudoalteromonas mariniglutinosa NCIMB 1770]|nr:hypothetical protein [Pseudoalteromonas mariniglutinosa NCIMB 1770]
MKALPEKSSAIFMLRQQVYLINWNKIVSKMYLNDLFNY